MRCPFCGKDDTQVKDSRASDDGGSIRRRRRLDPESSRPGSRGILHPYDQEDMHPKKEGTCQEV